MRQGMYRWEGRTLQVGCKLVVAAEKGAQGGRTVGRDGGIVAEARVLISRGCVVLWQTRVAAGAWRG